MNTEREKTSLIITGVGGQGNVLAAKLLAAVALKEGYETTVGDVYGLTQRGGSVASHVRWTRGHPLPPLVPRRSLDFLVAFEPLEALRILVQFGKKTTRALINDVPVMPIGVQTGRFRYPDPEQLRKAITDLTEEVRFVNGLAVARGIGNPQVLNMVMLGAVCGLNFLGFSPRAFESIIRSSLPPKLVDMNLKAFQEGLTIVDAEGKT